MATSSQHFLDNLVGLPTLWDQITQFVLNNRFDMTRLEVNPLTGHLIAHESGNLKLSIDSNGHLLSEVE